MEGPPVRFNGLRVRLPEDPLGENSSGEIERPARQPQLDHRSQLAVLVACVWSTALVVSAFSGFEPLLLLLVLTMAAYLCVRSERDPAALLTVYIVLLYVIPPVWTVPGIGASGRPALLLGMLALAWMGFAATVPSVVLPGGPQPLRFALAAFVCSALASYSSAFFRPLLPAELSGLDRGLLLLVGMAGIALLAADGIMDRSRLDTLLRRLVLGTAVLASIGLLQFATGFDVAARIRIPGLVLVDDAQPQFISLRGGFRRVAATTGHPIEFAVVLGTVLPIALHYALVDIRTRGWRWCVPLVLVAAAIPTTLSRTGILAVAVALVMLVPTWPGSLRWKAGLMGGLSLVMLQVAVPGLLGTLLGLFLDIGSDSSVSARTSDYAAIGPYLGHSLLFGRGIYTWLADQYFILDNQYLVTLIEQGIQGLTALLMLFVVSASLARGARRRSTDPTTRHLGQALAAAVIAAMATFATYDALTFSVSSGILALLFGCCGALWRLERPPWEHHPLDLRLRRGGARCGRARRLRPRGPGRHEGPRRLPRSLLLALFSPREGRPHSRLAMRRRRSRRGAPV